MVVTPFKWFDKQRSYLDNMESQLRGLVKAVELVAKQRQGKKNTFAEGPNLVNLL
jgi:hypothetical protein